VLALERQAADRPSVWGAVRVVVDTDGTAADRPSPRLAEVMAGPRSCQGCWETWRRCWITTAIWPSPV
jgi:hypothetical protein